MYDVQGYKCVSKGVVMYSFQRNKVYELTSSVFYSSLCLFRRNNYTFGVVSLGRLWNILYEKEPLQLCFTMLRRKAAVFLYQNLIMRCYVTILTEIYDDPTFFGSGPGFVNPIRSDPVQILLTPLWVTVFINILLFFITCISTFHIVIYHAR